MPLVNMTFLLNNLTSDNGTTQPPELEITGPHWRFMPIFYILTSICSLTTNGTVLFTILTRNHLRTTFNLYIINLLTANILMVILQTIPDLFSHLYSGWIWGEAYCSVLLFGLYMFEAGIQNCHSIIAINRIWAVYWPHHYRSHHSKRTAALLILAGWLEVSAMVLPGYVMDTIWYRRDSRVFGCDFNFTEQLTWSIFVQFAVYDVGPVIMWVAYPLIWYKRRQAKRISPGTVTAHSQTKKVTAGNDTDLQSVDDMEREEEGSVEMKVNVVEESHHRTGGDSGRLPARKSRTSNSARILTVLTISVTICWTPSDTVYTVMMWVPYGLFNSTLLTVCTVLFYLQSVLDPILFCCALPELRQAVKKVLRCRG